MIVIIPLGGIGCRFKSNNYRRPKALIRIHCRPILYHLIDNLDPNFVDCICIPYHKDYADYRFESQLLKDFPNHFFRFQKLEHETEGAAQTINIAIKHLNLKRDHPVLCLDGDNFYTTNILAKWNGENKVFVFEDTESDAPIYSYIQTDSTSLIVQDIIEKERISSLACTGAYGFQSIQQLLHFSQRIIDQNIKQKGEFYTSTVIRNMIKSDISFTYETIHTTDYHCLGTPSQLRLFYNQPHKKKMRVCFDIDNTLVTFPKRPNDYSTVEPIFKTIQIVQELKRQGHTVVLYTARRMKTFNGNVAKAVADIAEITFQTLEKFNIPFDEIYFGKPHADIYIDDLAVNCFDDIEKEIGIYVGSFIEARDFNTIDIREDNTVIKKSANLKGEIYFYRHIPNDIRHLFPELLDADNDNFQWLKLQKIDGVPLTNLYLSEVLTPNELMQIMDAIQEIHDVKLSSHKIAETQTFVYKNYCQKMAARYFNYDYSRFPNHAKIYSEIWSKLQEYEATDCAQISVIHGDPVLTNIFLTKTNRVKFIDMRGKHWDENEDHLSIYGDRFYDWAKLYQSLIGYDKILQNQTLHLEYEKSMVQCFQTYFLERYSRTDFENMCWITKSLLFSLIPLHDNERCEQYYEMILSSPYLTSLND